MELITLKSIVSKVIIQLTLKDTVADALGLMSKYGISSIVVVDEEDVPLGIFTEHDALCIVFDAIDVKTPIEEVMTPNPFCVAQSMSIHDAYTLMDEKGYKHLVVTDVNAKLIGVVSEGDFLRHIGFDNLNQFKAVHEVMNLAPLVVQSDTPFREIASLINKNRCDYVIIMNKKHIEGLITQRDIANMLCSTNEAIEEQFQTLLQKKIQFIGKNALLLEAASKMQEHNVHELIVMDDANNLVGLLNRHDILHNIHGSYFEFLFKVIEQKNSTIADLHERKNKLREQKEFIEQNNLKYLKLFEAMPDGVLLIQNSTMQAVEFNKAAYENLGYTAAEFSQLKITDYNAKETTPETVRRIEAVQTHGSQKFETIHRTKDGRLLDVFVNVVAITLSDVSYMMAIYRDITEQKKTENSVIQKHSELLEQKSFLYTLINTIPDLIWLKNSQGVYLACNKMFEKFYGASENEIIGHNDFDFVDEELAIFFREHDKKAIESGTSSTNEEFLKFGDGSYEGYFETVKTPMKDENGNTYGVICVSRDISERKIKDELISNIQSLANIGTWEWDIVIDLFWGTDESYKIFDIEIGKKISFTELIEYFAPQERAKVKHMLFDVSKENKQFASLYKLIRLEGGFRWIKTHIEFLYDEAHTPIKAVGMVQDVTEQIEYQNEIIRKDAGLNEAQKLAKVGSWRLNIEENMLVWSDETYRIFGIDKTTQLTYKLFIKCIHPSDTQKVDNAWKSALQGEDYNIEHRVLVNNELKWVREHAKLEVDYAGKLLAGIGTVQDITEQKLYETKLEILANYDSLTGLANRTFLISNLQNSIEHAKRNKTKIALIIFDLDHFKDINNSYGHNLGDELLQHIAKRFTKRLRGSDFISRIGGDEFAVVVETLAQAEDAGRLAQEIIDSLSLEFILSGGASMHVGVSAGIAIYPNDGQNSSDILQNADAALNKSKGSERGTYTYYTDELTKLARVRVECENDLRRAIERDEFEVYYQPQVHIVSGRIIGAEALVRWNHPKKGVVSPLDFIPIAEEFGFISAIGEWVLNETCRQGKVWLDKGHRLILAVNLSAHQIRYQNIPLMVDKALAKSRYPASRLELEITESALMQREEEVVEMLHVLRAKGIRLAIDDFGTGYSSLSYLKRFPIDVLKIDKSFVDDIPYDADDVAIVTAIIAMAHALGFQVLAEGTERAEQIEFLREKGCTMYQGYFKSKPVPAAEFEKLLV